MKVFIEDLRTGETLKLCSKCNQYKNLGEYNKNRGRPYGVQSTCRKCCSSHKYLNREDHFWKQLALRTTKSEDGCLIWHGSKSTKGTPRIRWGGKTTNVRRVVYKLSVGELHDDMFVLDTCGHKDCVRGSHLRLGTKEEFEVMRYNRASDYLAQRPPEKASGFIKTQRGAKHRSAILTDDEARSIFKLLQEGKSQTRIAEQFGVHRAVVNLIARGKTWKNITGGLPITSQHGTKTCPESVVRGDQSPNSKITESEVRQIRYLINAEKKPLRYIAAQFGLSISTVSAIARRKSWKHVQ